MAVPQAEAEKMADRSRIRRLPWHLLAGLVDMN